MDINEVMQNVANAAREDMREAGYEELTTSDSVDEAFNKEGSTLVMVNSTCGCAGSIARPAAATAIHYDKQPDRLVTVFAGQDKEATDRARDYFEDHPPSSPAFALINEGQLMTMLDRSEIEGHDAIDVVGKLQGIFDEHCSDI